MINEWVNTVTQEHAYGPDYPVEPHKGFISSYWIAVVPLHRLCKEGYSYYEYKSDWAADANIQIRKVVEGEK